MTTQKIPERTIRELEEQARALYPILARIRRGMAALLDVIAAGITEEGGRGWN